MAITLGELAVRYGLELSGDPALDGPGRSRHSASATPGTLSFCSNAKYRRQLASTRATAVVLAREMLAGLPGRCADQPASLRGLCAHRRGHAS